MAEIPSLGLGTRLIQGQELPPTPGAEYRASPAEGTGHQMLTERLLRRVLLLGLGCSVDRHREAVTRQK